MLDVLSWTWQQSWDTYFGLSPSAWEYPPRFSLDTTLFQTHLGETTYNFVLMMIVIQNSRMIVFWDTYLKSSLRVFSPVRFHMLPFSTMCFRAAFQDCLTVGKFIATKVVLNEFNAFADLAQHNPELEDHIGELDQRYSCYPNFCTCDKNCEMTTCYGKYIPTF